MKKPALVFLGMLFIVFGGGVIVRAQDPVSPEKASLIKEVVEAGRVQEYYLETMTSMSQFAHDQAKDMVSELIDKDKTLSPAAKAAAKQMTVDSVENILAKTRRFFSKEVNFDEFVEKVFIPVFDKHFTESELRDLVAFYRSPTGQKIVKEIIEELQFED